MLKLRSYSNGSYIVNEVIKGSTGKVLQRTKTSIKTMDGGGEWVLVRTLFCDAPLHVQVGYWGGVTYYAFGRGSTSTTGNTYIRIQDQRRSDNQVQESFWTTARRVAFLESKAKLPTTYSKSSELKKELISKGLYDEENFGAAEQIINANEGQVLATPVGAIGYNYISFDDGLCDVYQRGNRYKYVLRRKE